MADSTGMADLRAENVSRVVTGFALQSYVLKQVCMVTSSNAWTETYYKETAADLTAGTTRNVAGVARLAKFPYGEVTWTETSGRNAKFAMEGVISWEDERTNAIDVIVRTLLRIGRAVASTVDGAIAAVIVAQAGNTQAANATWDNAVISSRDPVQDLLNGKSLISIDNYNAEGAYLLLHPTNYAQLLGNANVRNAGQFWTDAPTKNGMVGMIVGLKVLVTNSVTEGGCQIVVPKEAITWRSVSGLQVETINDPGVKKTIRAWEVGQPQVTNPDAICKITGI